MSQRDFWACIPHQENQILKGLNPLSVPSRNLERWKLYLGSFLVTPSPKMGSDPFCPPPYLDCNPGQSTFSRGLLLFLTWGSGPHGNLSSNLLKVHEGIGIRSDMDCLRVEGGLE